MLTLTFVECLEGEFLSVVVLVEVWQVGGAGDGHLSEACLCTRHGALLQGPLDHDPLTDVPQCVGDLSCRCVTPEHMTHVLPGCSVTGNIGKISEEEKSTGVKGLSLTTKMGGTCQRTIG